MKNTTWQARLTLIYLKNIQACLMMTRKETALKVITLYRQRSFSNYYTGRKQLERLEAYITSGNYAPHFALEYVSQLIDYVTQAGSDSKPSPYYWIN